MNAQKIKIVVTLILSASLFSCDGSDSENTLLIPITAEVRPNILLVIADDLGLDASAQYGVGSDLPVTPTLDGLAADGIVFENAWATPACTTTRGTLITGQHGVNSGVDTVPDELDTSALTLQRHLANQAASSDYQSAVIGKWHIAGSELDPNHPNLYGVPYYSGNMSGTLSDYSDWDLITNGVASSSTTYHTTAVTDMALEWIVDQSDPWFMWLAYSAPHAPFHLPPSDLHDRYLLGTEEDIAANERDYYLAAMEALDSEVGRLLNELPEGERDNTLVIFIGDNGTPRSVIDTTVFPQNHAKGTIYEGGIRIPMIVAGYGVDRKGERESALVNTVDIYPTIVDTVGADQNTAIDGQSFFGLLSSADAQSREYNYSEVVSTNTSGWTVRNSTHKLLEFANGDKELYSLEADLEEEVNLIASSESGYEDLIAELSSFADFIRSSDPIESSVDGDSVDITDATLIETSPDCANYSTQYTSTALDQINDIYFNGDLVVSVDEDECVFQTNAIPNHTFHDGDGSFAYDVAPQNVEYRISRTPQLANDSHYIA